VLVEYEWAKKGPWFAAPRRIAQRLSRMAQARSGPDRRSYGSSGPRQGQNVDFKVYYTNIEKNVHRRFLGQCRMNDFAVGSFSNCDFTLPTIDGVNAGTLEESYNLEMEIDTALDYETRPALGPISYTGTTFSTPANRLAPNCPLPTPDNGFEVVDIVNPLPYLIRPSPGPSPLWELPNGDALAIPPRVSVVRTFDFLQ
jgi:hypothetical protein